MGKIMKKLFCKITDDDSVDEDKTTHNYGSCLMLDLHCAVLCMILL